MRNCKARIMGTITAVLVFLSVGVAHAQRRYVETRVVSTGTATGLSAFANQLAPDPVTGMCLQADVSNRTVWGPCGSLPSGTPGQVAGVVAVTETQTTVITGTQTMTGTQTVTYATTNTGTITGTTTQTGTITQTGTATAVVTASYTYTTTSTTTSIVTSGDVSSGHAKSKVAAADGYLFSLGGGYLDVYGLANPDAPNLIGSMQLYNSGGAALCISDSGPDGKTIYAGSDTRVEAFSVGPSPSYLGYGTAAGKAYGCAAAGDRLYLSQLNGNKIEVMSIATRSAPAAINSVSATNPYGMAASGSNLYTTRWYGDRLETWSLSDPNTPTYVGYDTSATSSLGLSVFGPRAFSVSSDDSVIEVWSISTPSNPSKLETVAGGFHRAIAVWGARAYLVNGNTTIYVYNLDKYGLQAETQTTTNTQTATETQTATNTQTATVTLTTLMTGTATETLTATSTKTLTGTETATNTGWSAVSANIGLEDPLLWKYVATTGSTTGTATATSISIAGTNPQLTIKPSPLTFACSTISTDQTLSGSLTLVVPYGVMVSVGPITPKVGTTALRFRVSYSGKGTGGASVANVEALTGDIDTPSHFMWVPNAWITNTVASGSYTTGYNDVIAWDSHWSSATTFRLRMTRILMPFASDASGTRACLEVEELKL